MPRTVAIASGKGGTGKTTVAVNLAIVAARADHRVAYLDCDVEAPNGHIFLTPRIDARRDVSVPVPVVNPDTCTHCGKCAEICRYGAIAAMNQTVLVFNELCHGCGGCTLVCKPGAITEQPHNVGQVEIGSAGTLGFASGLLSIGQPMSPPVIHAVRAAAPPADTIIIDAPPGVSCPVVASITGTDFLVLVTEPTPFGLHDLKLAVDTARVLSLPHAVVINRADAGDGRTVEYCKAEGVEILAEIPDDRRIAEAYARGEILVRVLPDVSEIFEAMWERIQEPLEIPDTGETPVVPT